MLLALQFRDEFHRVRNIFSFASESNERKRAESETREESLVLDEHFIKVRRLQSVQETLRKLYEASWEAEVLLGKEDAKLIQPFDELFSNLLFTIEFYFEEQARLMKSTPEKAGIDMVRHDANRKIIYGMRSDSMGQQVEDAVNILRNRLMKHVK
jgi:hypothetical protein